jgi:hypothetical protein
LALYKDLFIRCILIKGLSLKKAFQLIFKKSLGSKQFSSVVLPKNGVEIRSSTLLLHSHIYRRKSAAT